VFLVEHDKDWNPGQNDHCHSADEEFIPVTDDDHDHALQHLLSAWFINH
jgi:hypothetical protein